MTQVSIDAQLKAMKQLIDRDIRITNKTADDKIVDEVKKLNKSLNQFFEYSENKYQDAK